MTRACLSLAVLASLAISGCQHLQVSNLSSVPAGELTRVERAVQIEAHAVRQAWGTPDISFGSDGWPIVLAAPPTPGELSFHNGGPAAYVWTDGKTSDVSSGPPPLPWSQVFSHEILEMIGNPGQNEQRNGWPLEIADPVLRVPVNVNGVELSDFVTPAWFIAGSKGPWDYARVLHGPFEQIR